MTKGLQSASPISSAAATDLRAEHSALLDEIRALRNELKTLSQNGAATSDSSQSVSRELNIALDRVVGERKPFVLRCHGIFDFELKLSSMRAALFLALLLDVHDRSAGGATSSEITTRMATLYRSLEGTNAPDEQIAALVRVGLYRLELSLVESPLFEGSELSLAFNSQLHRLEIAGKSKIQRWSDLSVSISSSDPKILALIDSLLATSPLSRARKQKSMYISSSERGWDQLFLEYFNHTQAVQNTSLYYRPALPTFPDALLTHIKASAATIARKRVMLQGYRSGRVTFHEILNRQTLWEMITKMPNGNFKLYPPGVTGELVTAHLQELQLHLDSYEKYSLSLTDAVFPFIVGVIQIGEGEKLDAFTMFYRQAPALETSDVTCFVLHDPFVAQSVLSRVISAVLEHPSTSSDRAQVREEISHVLDYFLTNGPIVKEPA
ncbi:MAG: hypothetical protein J0M12_17455 [Deltaproteobacteria bacterium]|nr:hypothetical protein [Deltaproteobacteria bacterium]